MMKVEQCHPYAFTSFYVAGEYKSGGTRHLINCRVTYPTYTVALLLVGGQIFLHRIELLHHKSYLWSNLRYFVEFVYVAVDDASMIASFVAQILGHLKT